MKRFVWLAVAFTGAVACGDDEGGDPDAPQVIDAADAAIDADDTDAAEATFSGSISFLEAQVLAPGDQGAFFGQGNQISISFVSSDDVPGPVMQEMTGPIGCKAWEYTPAQTAALIGRDEGTVAFTVEGTGAPSIPTCAFVAGAGYACPHANTAGNTGTIAVVQPGVLASLTVVAAPGPYNAMNTTNRYVRISGATTAANNGVFPIVQRPSDTTIVYANGAAVAEALPATATRVNLAGVGPTPQAPDPGFLGDDNTFMAAFTPGAGSHFAAFTSSGGAATVGDDFTLATAEAAELNDIPLDGTEFTLSCETGSCGAGSATGTILNIVTTDGAVPTPVGASNFFAMPPPVTKRVQVRCAQLGVSSITVPAAYSEFLRTSGATRVQASFIRPLLVPGGPNTVTVVAGHAIVGFTTVPP
jgi:hypothetical protein